MRAYGRRFSRRTSRAYPSGSAEGYKFRFLASQCQGCPLWDKCRDPKSKAQSHRHVFIRDYQLQQRQALAFTQSSAGKELLQRRPQIERVIAGLVRYNGARQAKAKGVAGADLQAKLCAVAYNLKRWRTLIQERNKTKAEHSPPAIG